MSPRKYDQRLRAEAATETRRRILDAVEERLREAPAERIAVDDIARRAGVARSTIYLLFGSRAGLFDAFGLDLIERAGIARVREAIANPDPRATVRDGIRAGAHVYAANRDVLRALFSMAQLDTDAFAGAVERMLDDRRRHMRRLARRLREHGALRSSVTEAQAAHLLWVLTSFETFDQLFDGQGLDAEAAADLLVATAERSVLA
jgi:AcrR family transcriptional regulator